MSPSFPLSCTSVFKFDFNHAFGFFSRLTGHVYDSPVRYDLFADSDTDGQVA
jgi:hypothetical protein